MNARIEAIVREEVRRALRPPTVATVLQDLEAAIATASPEELTHLHGVLSVIVEAANLAIRPTPVAVAPPAPAPPEPAKTAPPRPVFTVVHKPVETPEDPPPPEDDIEDVTDEETSSGHP